MTDTYYYTPLRSSLPQEQWRREADAKESRRRAVEAAGRRRERAAVQAQLQQVGFLNNQSAAATTERSTQTQLATLRSEFDALREATLEHMLTEFEELRKELRLDAERQVKRRLAELEREFETKLAGLRMPQICGTHSENKIYLQHDIVAKNGGSYISRKDNPGVCPGPDWQQLTQPGKTGAKGERGFAGARGPQGESGKTFRTWKIDVENFVAIPLMDNGEQGPRLHLRQFFQRYHDETNQARERE